MKSTPFKFYKFISYPLSIIILIHFLKDITQDILYLDTPLNKLGNIEEDLSNLSRNWQWLYHWAAVNSFILELALIFALPKPWHKNQFSKLDYFNLSAILYLIIFFLISFLLS